MVVNPTTLPPEVALQFGNKMLATPVPYLVYNIAADPQRMAARAGNILTRRRYNPFPTATVPLGPLGDTPPPIDVAFVDIQVPMQFYGQYTRIEEQTTLTNQDSVLNNLAQRFGVALRQTEDELTRNMLQSTASQINCVNGVNGRVIAVLKSSLMDLELLAA